MITDLKTLIDTCRQELHDREYHAHHADILVKEWDAVSQWFFHRGISKFGQDIGYRYCDEEIGSHIIVEGMSSRQKKRLRAVRMLISYQQHGDFEFRTPRVERTYTGETGQLILQFFQHERTMGRSEKTIECREISLYRFNQYLISHSLGFADLDIDAIEDFFRAMGYTLSARHTCANHLRQLFHYLYDHGYTPTDNALFVLKDQYRDQCKIPTTYTEDEISRMLSAVERSSAIGKRDYLIILLAAEYGWRSGAFKQMVDQGMDMYVALPVLSTYLGHKTIYATERYVRLTMEFYPYIGEKCSAKFHSVFGKAAVLHETD